MSAATFDTLSAAHDLEAVGFEHRMFRPGRAAGRFAIAQKIRKI